MSQNQPPAAPQPTWQPAPPAASEPPRPSRQSDYIEPARATRQSDPVAITPVVTGRYQFRAAAWIWFTCAAIEILLGADFLLRLFGASTTSGFVNFLYQVAGVFAAPFHGIWPVSSSQDSVIDPALLAAMVFYVLLAWGIIRILKITGAEHGTKPAA